MNTVSTAAATNETEREACKLEMLLAPYGTLGADPKVAEEEAAAQLNERGYIVNSDGAYIVLEPVGGNLNRQHLFYTALEALDFITSADRAELAAVAQLEGRGYQEGSRGWELMDIRGYPHRFATAREAVQFVIADDDEGAEVRAELQCYVDAGDELNNEPAAVLVNWAELRVDIGRFSDIAEALDWMARNMAHGANGEVGNVNVYGDEDEEGEASYCTGDDGTWLTISGLLELARDAEYNNESAPVPSWWDSDWTKPKT